MGLFVEATARQESEEIASAYITRDLLCSCPALLALLETSDLAVARQLLMIGTSEPPQDGEAFTVGELEHRIAWGQLYPKLSENSFLVVRNVGGAISKKEGYFRLHLRRQVRQAEYLAVDGRNDAWRQFWFLTSKLCEEFVALTDEATNNPGYIERQIRRDGGPAYNLPHQPNYPEFGYFLFANFLLTWATAGGEQ